MPVIDPYLFFGGNCADAMRFYEKTLGGKLTALMTYGQSPMGQCEPGMENLVMHASLVLDGRTLMASDAMPDKPYEGMKNVAVSIAYPTAAEAKKIYALLAEGGEVQMPMDKTFWAE